MQARVEELNSVIDKITRGGDTKARRKHVDRGKLLPRQRIDRLTDADTPFLELSALAGYQVYADKVPAGENLGDFVLKSVRQRYGNALKA